MKGEEFHVAVWPGTWDHLSDKQGVPDLTGATCDLFPAIREHAFEAGCFVISASGFMERADVPEGTPFRNQMNLDWACGGSVVVDPTGNYLTPPVIGKEEVIYAECEADSIKVAKSLFDALGHYARFDVARLELREEPWTPFANSKVHLTSSELRRLGEKYGVSPDKLEKIYSELAGESGVDSGSMKRPQSKSG